MAKKEAPAAPVSVTRTVVTPQDPRGLTTALKRELARSIGRMGGKAENLDIVLGTLKAFGDHAKAKVKEQKAAQEAAVKAAKEKAELQIKRTRKAAELKIANKEAHIAVLKGEIEAVAKQAGIKEEKADK